MFRLGLRASYGKLDCEEPTVQGGGGTNTAREVPNSPPGRPITAASGGRGKRGAARWLRRGPRHPQSASGPTPAPSAIDLLQEQGALDGLMLWALQRYLHFGSDAKPPRETRPVMRAVLRMGPRIPVLPATSAQPRDNGRRFYHLATQDVEFTDTSRGYSPFFLFRKFEKIPQQALTKEIGCVREGEREKIRLWLIGRRTS